MDLTPKLPRTDRKPFHEKLIPPNQRLIVTTRQNVYSFDREWSRPLFKSGSGGVVAAELLDIGDEQLAVADSQIVLIYDAKKGTKKSLRLKGEEGIVKTLKQYGDTLYYTSALQSSVQDYSFQEDRTMGRLHAHASPPTCFAVSPDGRWILSTSDEPPSVMIQDTAGATPLKNIQPEISKTKVRCAAFHPTWPHLCALGFDDGSLTIIDVMKGTSHSKGMRRGMYPLPKKAVQCGIIHIAFLPHSVSQGFIKIVFLQENVGCFSTCCTRYSFVQVRPQDWLTYDTPTCLSVLDHDDRSLIAIGHRNGTVRFYDQDRNMLGIKSFGKEPILNVSWMSFHDKGEVLSHAASKETITRTTRSQASNLIASAIPDYLDLFSPVRPGDVRNNALDTQIDPDTTSVISAPQLWDKPVPDLNPMSAKPSAAKPASRKRKSSTGSSLAESGSIKSRGTTIIYDDKMHFDEMAKMRQEMATFQLEMRRQLLAQKIEFETTLSKDRAERKKLLRKVENLEKALAQARDDDNGRIMKGL